MNSNKGYTVVKREGDSIEVMKNGKVIRRPLSLKGIEELEGKVLDLLFGKNVSPSVKEAVNALLTEPYQYGTSTWRIVFDRDRSKGEEYRVFSILNKLSENPMATQEQVDSWIAEGNEMRNNLKASNASARQKRENNAWARNTEWLRQQEEEEEEAARIMREEEAKLQAAKPWYRFGFGGKRTRKHRKAHKKTRKAAKKSRKGKSRKH